MICDLSVVEIRLPLTDIGSNSEMTMTIAPLALKNPPHTV
jgi:hypothetical protein